MVLETGVCPESVVNAGLLGIFVLISLFLLFIFFNFKKSFLGMFSGLFSSVIFISLSWIISGCSAIISLVIGGLGIIIFILSITSFKQI